MKHDTEHSKHSGEGNHDHCDHDKGKVSIAVDEHLKVEPGTYTAAAIKAMAGTPASFELDIIVDGRLIPLRDDEPVHVKGGERFSAQPRCGASS